MSKRVVGEEFMSPENEQEKLSIRRRIALEKRSQKLIRKDLRRVKQLQRMVHKTNDLQRALSKVMEEYPAL